MNRYRVFVKVIECGSFTKAAQELNYTQSAVSQMVHTLEEELSSILISRSKTGVTLTADGKEYFPYIRTISNAHRELEEKQKEMIGLHSGKIRVGTFTSISRNWLPGIMKQFKTLYPTVRFELFQGEYTNISQWIKDGTVDFGFVTPAAVQNLQILPLYSDEMAAVFPQGHPLAKKDFVTLSDLTAYPYILLDEGELSVPLNAFQEHALTPDIQYRVYDDYSILAMVEQGLGISILYRTVLENLEQPFVSRPIVPAVTRTVAVACKNKQTLPIASRFFLDFILKHFTSSS